LYPKIKSIHSAVSKVNSGQTVEMFTDIIAL
jgi:hypothetical protein